ncbi:MAG: hypothetical protein R2747_16695 [Pyrinomonadaceae bacterium]
MNPRLSRFILPVITLIVLSLNIAGQGDSHPTATDTPEVTKAKRQIVKLLLKDIFRGKSGENIYLSTKNLPPKLMENFPKFKNLTARFVAEGGETETTGCPFEFRIFQVSGRKASVLFGDCRNGLGYNFEKVGGKWRFAPLEIEND